MTTQNNARPVSNDDVIAFISHISLVSDSRIIPEKRLTEIASENSNLEESKLPNGVRRLITANPIPKSLIAEGVNIRQNVYDRLDVVGLKSSKGTIIAPSKMSDFVEFLREKEQQWIKWVEKVDATYDQAVADQINATANDPRVLKIENHERFIELVWEYAPAKDDVVRKLNFDWDMNRIENIAGASRLGKLSVAESALDSMIEEIVRKAKDLYAKLEEGKGRATQSQTAKALRLAEKVDAFTFISPKLIPVAEKLIVLFAQLSAIGKLTGQSFAQFRQAMRHLSSLDNVRNAVRNGESIIPDYIMTMSSQMSMGQLMANAMSTPEDAASKKTIQTFAPGVAEKLDEGLTMEQILDDSKPETVEAQVETEVSQDADVEADGVCPYLEVVSEEQEDQILDSSEETKSNKEIGMETLNTLKSSLSDDVHDELSELNEYDQELPDTDDFDQTIQVDDDAFWNDL